MTSMDGGELRDRLALERTRLANERTLLAYVRTALALGAGGAALMQFFPTPSLQVGAWILIVAAFAVVAAGVSRFRSVRKGLPK
jgi:putative membrane protein